MKRLLNFVLAAGLAGGASLASAQVGPYGSSAGLGSPPPSSLSPYGTGMPSATGFGSTGPLLFSPNASAVSSSQSFGYATSPPLGSYGSSMGLAPAVPSPLIPGQVGAMAAPSPTTRYPLANCYAGGCFGTDGTQYTRGAGNVLFGSNGKICQYTASGAPLVCN